MWPAALGRPVQLLGRGREGVRRRRGQRPERGDRRIAPRPDPAGAAGAQPAGRALAVLDPHHAGGGRAGPRADRDVRERREAGRREEDVRQAAVGRGGVPPGVCRALPEAPRGDDRHRDARRAARPGVRVGQGRPGQGVRLQPAPGLRPRRGPRPVRHDRAARVRLVLRRRHVHQRLGDLVVRRPRHHPAVAGVPPQAPAGRRQDDARAVAGRRLPPVVRGLPLRLLPRRHDAALHHRGARLRARDRRRRVRARLLAVDPEGVRLLRVHRRERRRPDGQHEGRPRRGDRQAAQP